MGILSRNKGKVFERKVAAVFRERFPQIAADVRRSIQSRKAEESDVTGVPGLWIECQDAARPEPLVKLLQAERDRDSAGALLIPVAVTHKKGEKTIQATLRVRSLALLASDYGLYPAAWRGPDVPVTLDLLDFVELAADSIQARLDSRRRDQEPRKVQK